MSLSTILLVVFLALYAVVAMGWAAIASWVVGLFALMAAVAFVLEGLGAVSVPIVRRKP